MHMIQEGTIPGTRESHLLLLLPFAIEFAVGS